MRFLYQLTSLLMYVDRCVGDISTSRELIFTRTSNIFDKYCNNVLTTNVGLLRSYSWTHPELLQRYDGFSFAYRRNYDGNLPLLTTLTIVMSTRESEADIWFLVPWTRFPDCTPRFFVMQIRVIFAFPPLFGAPSLGALGSCPTPTPTPRSATFEKVLRTRLYDINSWTSDKLTGQTTLRQN